MGRVSPSPPPPVNDASMKYKLRDGLVVCHSSREVPNDEKLSKDVVWDVSFQSPGG